MEFSVNLFSIQKALRTLNSVARQNTDEVAGQVLLDIHEDGNLVLLCNNGSLAITCLVNDCTVKSTGVSCVAYGKLMSFLNAFSSLEEDYGVDVVNFKGLKNDLTVSLENYFSTDKKTTHKLKLKLFPSNKMVVPTPFKNTFFNLNSGTLRLAISKVIYAVNQNSIRNFLQGVNISFDDNYIYFAGTDAQMLSEYRTSNTGSLHTGSYTVPYGFIMALRKIIDSDSEIYFDIDNNNIKAVVNKTTLHGTLLIGEEFPKYAPAFDNFKHELVINKDILLNSFVPFMNTLDPEDHHRLTISLHDNKLLVKSDTAESECFEDISFAGNFVVDVNGSFLYQTVSAILDDIIRIRFSTESGTLIFDAHQFENQKALLTPIRRK